ncbi:MAG: hypothetical protein IT159_09915 [Bryobacterales bacterium]|nr:hypothetical protein [Bryobacterales bacterium]
MAGYLETYGAGQVKRERRLKVVFSVALALAVAGGSLYFFLRNYHETRQAELFLNLLKQKDYTAAYALWGCTPSTPCPHYSMDSFMQDWGPESGHADLSKLQITKVKGCSTGVIIEANFGGGVIEHLWVDRASRQVGYAPFTVCNPVYRPHKK